MAIELERTTRVGHEHLRFARPFVGSSGGESMHNRDGFARRHAPTPVKLQDGQGFHRGNHAVRALDPTTQEEGDRASTSGVEMG